MTNLAILAFFFAVHVPSMGLPQVQPTAPTVAPVAAHQDNVPPAAPPVSARDKAMLRADVLMARKQYQEAIAAYKDCLRENPRDALVLNKLGIAFQQLGDAAEATRYYKKALKVDAKSVSAMNNLGTIEYGKKKYANAVRWYEKALVVRTDMPAIYCNLGYAYFGGKKFPEAMSSFSRAVALDPSVFDKHGITGSYVQQRSMDDPGLFYYYLARTFAASGNAEQCAHYLKLSRDEGYAQFSNAQTDPTFAKVVGDPRVQRIFHPDTPPPDRD
jgi:tetratricopeptide (TPR) repeat protein